MAEIAGPDPMQDISTESTGPVPTVEGQTPVLPVPAPEDEQVACETLYIQNLNEKIKPEGILYSIL